jgi:DNA (cytosine-5)-methyltransferase 1
MMLAGFPCQPFSYAGKRKGFGDTRGTLFFEIERILDKNRPKAFLLENVRGLRTHDGGRTFETIISNLNQLGYGTHELILNSSDFNVPHNRVRLYILGILGATPTMSLVSDYGAVDSHKYKDTERTNQLTLFDSFLPAPTSVVRDILEESVEERFYCSNTFASQLKSAIGEDLSKLHGYRLIDYRGGQSLHSWELGTKGKCSQAEITFMNILIKNRRKHEFGTHQDGKKLTIEQIRSFYTGDDIDTLIASLKEKGYLKEENGRFNPTAGNMSFEVFKFLDPESISITLTSSDANRLGIIQNNIPRKITPRECARLQGFPDSFIVHPEDSFAYKQFGNSVSVPVIEAVVTDFIKQNEVALNWSKPGKTNLPHESFQLVG